MVPTNWGWHCCTTVEPFGGGEGMKAYAFSRHVVPFPEPAGCIQYTLNFSIFSLIWNQKLPSLHLEVYNSKPLNIVCIENGLFLKLPKSRLSDWYYVMPMNFFIIIITWDLINHFHHYLKCCEWQCFTITDLIFFKSYNVQFFGYNFFFDWTLEITYFIKWNL